MRLSLDRLEAKYAMRSKDLDKIFSNVTKVIHEEIDNLQTFAAEFSKFARLPEAVMKHYNVNKQLAEISTIKKESDSYRSALRELLHRNQWMIEDDLDSETDKLIAELAELKAASERVGDLYWLDAPVTLEIIESCLTSQIR